MKHFLTVVSLFLFLLPSAAQKKSADEYSSQYDRLVAHVGVAGLGVQTVLSQWERDWPDDPRLMAAAFQYHFHKARTPEVIKRDTPRYLGNQPLFSLNDTIRRVKVYYFEDDVFDDAVFRTALSYLERAIQKCPDRLDFRLRKAAALLAYEKESPDMAASFLKDLVVYHGTLHPNWEMPGVKADEAFFRESMQEYCFHLFRIATPVSYEAFRELSALLLKYWPREAMFLDNMGSYYLVVKSDRPTALKWYDKALKINQKDMTAIQNGILAGRSAGNVKTEKKYLKLMVRWGEGVQKQQAEARLAQLSGKAHKN